MISACGGSKKTEPVVRVPEAEQKISVEVDEKEVPLERACKALYTEGSILEGPEFNMAQIMEAKIEGNCLRLRYQYSGCNQGEALLQKVEISSKKGGVAHLALRIQGAGLCEMLLAGEESYFDLSSLAQGPEAVEIFVNQQSVGFYRAY